MNGSDDTGSIHWMLRKCEVSKYIKHTPVCLQDANNQSDKDYSRTGMNWVEREKIEL
jgi:hypothetical protein